jgi:hypothetical protein
MGRVRGHLAAYAVAVTSLIRAVTGSRELEGPGWRLALERPVARSERLGPFGAGDGWTAVLGVRRGLKLLVTGDGEVPDPLIEAWAGEPGESSDGIAVIELAGGGLAVTRVPLCRCGDRGCGNAGIQLSKQVPAGEVPELVALLRELPWSDVVPTRSNVLRGDGLAALPLPRDSGRPSKVVYHGARLQDGVLVPVRRVLRDKPGPQGQRGYEEQDGQRS